MPRWLIGWVECAGYMSFGTGFGTWFLLICAFFVQRHLVEHITYSECSVQMGVGVALLEYAKWKRRQAGGNNT